MNMLPCLLAVVTLIAAPVHATPAIAVWAYPDGVSLPYRDNDNQVMADSTAYIGVVAYHSTGITRVAFVVQGETTDVTVETVNPETGEYEYVLGLDPAVFTTDGEYAVGAVAFPGDGEPFVLSERTVFKDTETHAALSVGAGSFATLEAALDAATSGDLVLVGDGEHEVPGYLSYGFTKYVTVRAVEGAQPVFRLDANLVINTDYLKFEGIDFRVTDRYGVANYGKNHVWFNECGFIGLTNDYIWGADNSNRALWCQGSTHDIVAERCTFTNFSQGASLTGAGNWIVRQCRADTMTSIGYTLQTGDALLTGSRASVVGSGIRSLAWSVSKNDAGTYDFGTGAELAFHLTGNKGTSWDTVAVVHVAGTLSTNQVIDALNADSAFRATFEAMVAEYPYPHAGNIRIVYPVNNEFYRFYATGGAVGILQLSDNLRELNDISIDYPARNGEAHYDYVQNVGGDYTNVVYRNNHFAGSRTPAFKFGTLGGGNKENVAIINNVAHTVGGQVMFSGSSCQMNNILIEHNVLWNTGGHVNALWHVYDMTNSDWVVRNNILGAPSINDIGTSGYGYGVMDYNVYNNAPANGDGGDSSLVADPLFTDLDGFDFSLQSGSPAIGLAVAGSGIFYDINWNLRDDEPDAGAYEYAAVSIAPGMQDADDVSRYGIVPNPIVGSANYGETFSILSGAAGRSGVVIIKSGNGYVKRVLLK